MLTYSQVTFQDLRDRFGIQVESGTFLPAIAPIPLPSWLVEYLRINEQTPAINRSEKAVSETIIAPVLAAFKQHCNGQLGIFSGEPLSGAGLMGICDFILTPNPRAYLPEPPLLVVVEAKRQDLLTGIPQCVAEMLAVRAVNRQAGLDYPVAFGCVTTGAEWQFLRLTDDLAITDPGILYFDDLERVLGSLAWIVAQFR